MSEQGLLDFKVKSGDEEGDPRVQKLEKPSVLTTACSISVSMPAPDFFRVLRQKSVTLLVDTRLSRQYRGARFSHELDIRFICQELDIGYVYLDSLAPTKELRKELHKVLGRTGVIQAERAQAWTNFLKGYYGLLAARKVLAEGSSLRELLYAPHKKVAFACACPNPMDCHRRVLLGMISTFVEGIEVEHLTQELIGKSAPKLKSPRRYLVEPIPGAGLSVNLPPGWRS